jgi:hypothetical protein
MECGGVGGCGCEGVGAAWGELHNRDQVGGRVVACRAASPLSQ